MLRELSRHWNKHRRAKSLIHGTSAGWIAVWAILLSGLFASASYGASDFQWTLINNGFSSWSLTSVSSKTLFAGSLPAQNPTINLILGKRYAVTNGNPTFHPFEVIAKGTSSLSDAVLLSESAAGSLESDPDIAWSDTGSGTVEFTVTSALINAMRSGGKIPGYRCSVHTSTMRGDFQIFGDGVRITDPLSTITLGQVHIRLQPVAEGLISPLGLVDPNDGSGRLFIYDQAGKISILLDAALLPTPFLDVSNRLVPLAIVQGNDIGYDERGLLGFTFHPSFATNGKVYTYTSEPAAGSADFTVSIPPDRRFDHQSVVAEWRVSTTTLNVINPSTRREVLRIDEPQFNHNGGELQFGPDGMLYISLGDGGGADDQDGADFFGQPIVGHGPTGNGQNIETVLGSLLRIDVDGTNSANGHYGVPTDNPFVGAAGVDEIFAYGFRNPYRFSFDTADGQLYVADVGQNDIEEIDVVTKGNNYGWHLKEGTFYFDPNGLNDGFVTTVPLQPLPAGLADPIAEYDHGDGHAIVGGFVYRGAAIPSLNGRYVFGDFGGFASPSGELFYLDAAGKPVRFRIASPGNSPGIWVKGFGQDHAGEIYVCGSGQLGPSGNTGKVLKILPAPLSAKGWKSYP